MTGTLADLPAGIAPTIERHAWARSCALDLAPIIGHIEEAAAVRLLGRTGAVTQLTADALLSLTATDVPEEDRARAAWLYAYAVEAGTDAVHAGAAREGELLRGPVPGWTALSERWQDEPPTWWPYPHAGRCEACGDRTHRGATECGECPATYDPEPERD